MVCISLCKIIPFKIVLWKKRERPHEIVYGELKHGLDDVVRVGGSKLFCNKYRCGLELQQQHMSTAAAVSEYISPLPVTCWRVHDDELSGLLEYVCEARGIFCI